MPSILDAVRAAIQSCFSRHLLAFLLSIVYDCSMAIDLTESSTTIEHTAVMLVDRNGFEEVQCRCLNRISFSFHLKRYGDVSCLNCWHTFKTADLRRVRVDESFVL